MWIKAHPGLQSVTLGGMAGDESRQSVLEADGSTPPCVFKRAVGTWGPRAERAFESTDPIRVRLALSKKSTIEFPAARTLSSSGEAEQWLSVARLVHDDVETGQAAAVGVFAGGAVGALSGLVVGSSSPEAARSVLGWMIGTIGTISMIGLLFAVLLVLNTYFRRFSRTMVGLVMAYEARRVELAARLPEQPALVPEPTGPRPWWQAMVGRRRGSALSAAASAARRRGARPRR